MITAMPCIHVDFGGRRLPPLSDGVLVEDGRLGGRGKCLKSEKISYRGCWRASVLSQRISFSGSIYSSDESAVQADYNRDSNFL
jgi:hypothetical protein